VTSQNYATARRHRKKLNRLRPSRAWSLIHHKHLTCSIIIDIASAIHLNTQQLDRVESEDARNKYSYRAPDFQPPSVVPVLGASLSEEKPVIVVISSISQHRIPPWSVSASTRQRAFLACQPYNPISDFSRPSDITTEGFFPSFLRTDIRLAFILLFSCSGYQPKPGPFPLPLEMILHPLVRE
jgi:hypothetical protein